MGPRPPWTVWVNHSACTLKRVLLIKRGASFSANLPTHKYLNPCEEGLCVQAALWSSKDSNHGLTASMCLTDQQQWKCLFCFVKAGKCCLNREISKNKDISRTRKSRMLPQHSFLKPRTVWVGHYILGFKDERISSPMPPSQLATAETVVKSSWVPMLSSSWLKHNCQC